MLALQEKPRKPKKTGRNNERTKRNDPPRAPDPGLGHERSVIDCPTLAKPGGRLADPPGQGTPCRVPSSPRSATLLDVSPSLESQTTFKSDENRTIATVSKRPSQRRKNHVDTMSELQEKPRKTKKT